LRADCYLLANTAAQHTSSLSRQCSNTTICKVTTSLTGLDPTAAETPPPAAPNHLALSFTGVKSTCHPPHPHCCYCRRQPPPLLLPLLLLLLLLLPGP
jgi:hypothetical protein